MTEISHTDIYIDRYLDIYLYLHIDVNIDIKCLILGAFLLSNAEEVLQSIYSLEEKIPRIILSYREHDLGKILRQSRGEENKIDS